MAASKATPTKTVDDLTLITELRKALKAAQEHLEYCGYGDKWESECAEAVGLEKQIDEALAMRRQGERHGVE